jgi:hypothetical protein
MSGAVRATNQGKEHNKVAHTYYARSVTLKRLFEVKLLPRHKRIFRSNLALQKLGLSAIGVQSALFYKNFVQLLAWNPVFTLASRVQAPVIYKVHNVPQFPPDNLCRDPALAVD